MNSQQINKTVQDSLAKLSALVITSLFLLIATNIDLLLGPIFIILAVSILIILGFALWVSSEWTLRKITKEEKSLKEEASNTNRPTYTIEENMFFTNFNLFIVILFQDRDIIEHFLGPYAAILSTILAGTLMISVALLIITEAFKKQTNKDKIKSQRKEILNLIFNMIFAIPSSMFLVFLTRSKSVLIVFLSSNPLMLLIIAALLIASIATTHYLDANYNKFSNNKTEEKSSLKQHVMGHIKNFSIKFSKDMQKNLVAIIVVTICVLTIPQPHILLVIFAAAVAILIFTQISTLIHELNKQPEEQLATTSSELTNHQDDHPVPNQAAANQYNHLDLSDDNIINTLSNQKKKYPNDI